MAFANPQPQTDSSATTTEQHITFLDLPLHIRNSIYRIALHHHSPLELNLTTINDQKTLTLSTSPTPPTPPPLLALGLLLTNRQIHTESTPLLYNLNTFTFPSAKSLINFATTIGTCREHLRHIRMPCTQTNKALYKQAVNALRFSKNLQTLEVCGRGYDAGEHVETLKGLMVALRKGNEGRKVEELVGIVRLLPGGEGVGGFQEEEARDMTGRVREELGVLLGSK